MKVNGVKILGKFLFLFFLFSTPLLAVKGALGEDESETSIDRKNSPPPIGNFSVPVSQRPGPLIGFGLNYIGKNKLLGSLSGNITQGKHRNQQAGGGSLAYGLADTLAVYISTPGWERVQQYSQTTNGTNNMDIQINYAPYAGETSSFGEVASLATSVSLPTASTNSNLFQGVKNPRILVGGVFARMYTEWYGFTSQGILLGTPFGGVRIGNTFLSQFGVGRNILTLQSGWIFAVLVEIDGEFTQKDQVLGITNPNSGGSVVTVAPSFWIASKNWAFQFGGGTYLDQNLNGVQEKNSYFLVGGISYAF